MEDTDGIPAHHNSSVPHTPSLPQHSEEIVAMCGEYSLNYDTLRPVGKGAFGFVKLAQKKDDKSLVCQRNNSHMCMCACSGYSNPLNSFPGHCQVPP